jgi:hypothetical protein
MQHILRRMGLLAGAAAVSVSALTVCGLFMSASLAWAQGGSHITELRELEHDTSPPLDKIPPIPPEAGPQQVIPLHRTRGIFAQPPAQADPLVQSSVSGTTLSTSSGKNILGLGNGFSGPNGSFTVQYIPPDTNGAVGDTQFVQWVNASFAVFSKSTGSPVYGPAAGNTLWSSLGGPCARNNSGDPVAQYDKLANRWVLMQPVFKSPYYVCVAVSTSSDATGSYYRYAFPVPNSRFPDYPKLGVWSDGYYLTYNQFQGNSFQGAAACVLDRNRMLIGNTATMQCATVSASYGALLPADFDGRSASAPPAGSPGYFLNYDGNLASLDLWQSHVDWSNSNNSTFTGPTNIPVAAFSEACGGGACVPQSGTSQKLDSLGDRLMYRLAYRNFGSHESLLVNHSVDTGNGNTGIRWYELQNTGSGFGLYQQGTYAPDSNYRWMGSIAQDQAGDIALGYSVSSGSISPTIKYTGRVPGDTLGQMETENDLLGSITHGSQTSYARWGDYSSMAIDPVDDCTFWFTTEYQPTNGNAWSTRIASFSFSGCSGTSTPDFSMAASPSSLTLTQGQSSPSTVTVTALNGFAGTVNFSLSGCPSNPANACTISPGSVTGSGTATLTVTTDSTTVTGPYNITVAGTSGSLIHSTSVSLTVNAPATADFSVSASPGNRTLRAGGSAGYTVSVTPSGGYAGTVNLAVSGLPSNTTYSFTPPSVTGGSGSSTLTVNTTSSTPKGSYALIVTGTDIGGSPSHSTTVGLKVR